MFIEVTLFGETKPTLVNVDRILRITYVEIQATGIRNTIIVSEGGQAVLSVKDSYEDIKEKLVWCGRLNLNRCAI